MFSSNTCYNLSNNINRCSPPRFLPVACNSNFRSQASSRDRDIELSSTASRRTVISFVPLTLATAYPMLAGHAHAQEKATSGVQEQYDKFAPTYDVLDGGQAPELFGFDQLRSQLIGEVSGRALEVAVGTGLNLPLYRWKRTAVYGASLENIGVEDLTAIDISQGMLTEAVARVKGSPLLEDKPITLKQADATNLPFADESFDSIVDTFSLCVIEDPTAALREMARVLKPTGTAFLLEHSRSDNRLLAAYQDLTSSAVASSSKGCVWNQDVEYMLKEAGLTPKYLSRHVAGTVVLIKVVKTA